jgi:hypothetical protein
MKAVLVLAVALVAGGTAIAGLDPAVRMTLDGVGGACPGMTSQRCRPGGACAQL